MFMILLKFSDNKAAAPQYMEAHNQWLKAGFDEGIFLVSGSLKPAPDMTGGGAIIAHNSSASDLHKRLKADPFVEHDVVRPEVIEMTPGRTDDRLSFLLPS